MREFLEMIFLKFLSVENYGDILNGVGIMCKDYIMKRLDVYCKRISDSCIGYDFVSENNLPLIDIVMGACGIKWNWCLQTSKGRVILVKYKLNKKGEITKFRGKGADIDVTDHIF